MPPYGSLLDQAVYIHHTLVSPGAYDTLVG